MSDRLAVIEDGVDSPAERQPTRPSWLLVLVGFVVGLGLGVLVIRPDLDPAEQEGAVTSPSIPASTTTTILEEVPQSVGVAAAIPGFPDTMVAVAGTSSSSLSHLVWPLRGDLVDRSMTGGSGVALDATSNFIALSQEVPGLDGRLLSMGRFNTMLPVAAEVLSYAWHDSTSGSLSYMTNGPEGTILYTVRTDFQSIEVAEIAERNVAIIGWGDWGWAVQRNGSEIVFLNREGELAGTEPGVGLATHPSGWVLIAEETRLKLASAGEPARRLPHPLEIGTPLSAGFSPDGTKVAVAGTLGVALVDLETGEAVDLTGVAVPSVSWSSDSRFVLIPTTSGVAVFDTEDSLASYLTLRQHRILAVGVAPLHSS